MPVPRGTDATGLRGWGKLAFEATHALTHVVEGMHHEIARSPFVLGTPRLGPTRGVTGLVYRSIRGTTRALELAYDAVMDELEPAAADHIVTPRSEALRAALNGVVGDHLAATHNPLAIRMHLRRGGRSIALGPRSLANAIPDPRRHVVVLAHGLCMSDLGWARNGHDHGAALARDLGCTELYLLYNSGLHISENGRLLSELLDDLVRTWPVPLERLTLVGHSMGGLVLRSACHQAQLRPVAWLERVADLVCLGSPHLGAGLARGINWVHAFLGVSPYTAALSLLGKVWSAGATDLRQGYILERDWSGRDRFAPTLERPAPVPLPAGVRCFAIAGRKKGMGSLIGDGLVTVESALGRDHGRRSLDFADARCWVAHGVDHIGLLGDPGVYDRLRCWLADYA